MTGIDKIQLVYILSASHSGSTLLAMLLNSHPEVCSVGELKATSLGDPDRYLCSCGRRIGECSFWNDIRKRMLNKGIGFNISNAGTDFGRSASKYASYFLRPLHRGPVLERIRDAALNLSPTWRRQLPEIQNRNYKMMQCILEKTGKKILVDSSKIGLRLKYLLNNPLLKIKVIRLIRDGRGVVLTHTDPAKYADSRNKNLRGGGMNAGREKPRPIDRAAYEWRRSNEEAEEIIKRMAPAHWLQIRYETLCTEKEETLRRTFEFLKITQYDKTSNFRSVDHHIIGNGMRLDVENEIKLDERWKIDLKIEELKMFEAVAGSMNRKYDYE